MRATPRKLSPLWHVVAFAALCLTPLATAYAAEYCGGAYSKCPPSAFLLLNVTLYQQAEQLLTKQAAVFPFWQSAYIRRKRRSSSGY
jgi:hypothetical protein